MTDYFHKANERNRVNSPFNFAEYQQQYQQSITDPELFWAEKANEYLSWNKPWQTVLTGNLQTANWFAGGELNACYNCIDRHLMHHANETALIWQGDEINQTIKWTYQELHEQVCRLANVLKNSGIKKNDRVCIYLPMIPEAVVAMLACARIGAIHSVVFAGFSAEALKSRIVDTECKLLITADESMRGGKAVPLKLQVDDALKNISTVHTVVVVQRTFAKLNYDASRDKFYAEELAKVSADCPYEIMQAEDLLFILYTSGSTGKPKGIVHTTAGYLLYAAVTFKTIFDYREKEVYWCTADIGWITGHSYVVYGPLINRATILIYEGVPTYPDAGRFWQIAEQHQVNILYTAPTAIRALMREGEEWVTKYNRSSLRLLGSVGEPINPEVWEWYYRVVGEKNCPVIDTWWQTETGGFMIAPFAEITDLKAGSATLPFFGVKPALLDEHGKELIGEAEGNLVINQTWPGQARSIYKDHQRFIDTYLKPFPGYYFTGDGAKRDKDNYYWITGRVDDVINVAGHRLGTAEIESALVAHPAIAEAAVVGYSHDIKGQAIFAFVILKQNANKIIEKDLRDWVAKEISPIAKPEKILVVEGLPKTRSGKIMRRLLRKIADGQLTELGDTTTLADPQVIEKIIAAYKEMKKE